MKALFVDVVNQADRATALRLLARQGADIGARSAWIIDPSEFRIVPGSPFAYKISDAMRAKFRILSPFESDGRIVRQGMATSNDFRFVRTWYETAPGQSRWKTYSKGGESIGYYADFPVVVDWNCDGAALKAFAETTSGTTHWSRRIISSYLYFRPGITWPLRASRFSPRPMPAESIFSVRGYCAFMPREELLATLGLMLSVPVDALFKVCLGRAHHPEFVTGILKRLPWPHIDPAVGSQLSELARRAWSLRRSFDTAAEVSHAFVVPALLQVHSASLTERVEELVDSSSPSGC